MKQHEWFGLLKILHSSSQDETKLLISVKTCYKNCKHSLIYPNTQNCLYLTDDGIQSKSLMTYKGVHDTVICKSKNDGQFN